MGYCEYRLTKACKVYRNYYAVSSNYNGEFCGGCMWWVEPKPIGDEIESKVFGSIPDMPDLDYTESDNSKAIGLGGGGKAKPATTHDF